MPLPPSGADIVNQIRSTAIAAADFGLRTNGPKPNNIAGAIRYNSSRPTGFKRQSILSLQEKLNNLVFDPVSPSVYFDTINTILSKQPVPSIVTTVVTPNLASYFDTKGITLTPGTPILNLATTNQNGIEVFDIKQIEQINPGDKHYIYFSDTSLIQIGDSTIRIVTVNGVKKLRVNIPPAAPVNKNFGEEITIDGEKFEFLGSGSGGLFIYKGRNYAILNTTNTVTTEVIDPTLNNIDGCVVDPLGNVYVCDYVNHRVLKYDSTGSLISTFDSGFNNPRGIAVDSNDNVYVTNYDGNTISKISAAGIVTEVFTGLYNPYGIYFKTNKFYVSCIDSIEILELNATTGVIGLFDSIRRFDTTSKLRGIAVDNSNNIYVSSQKTDVIYKINTLKQIGTYYSGLNKPNGLTFDSSNNLYVANSGGNNLIKITNSNTGSQFSVGHANPQGLAINSGVLFITNKTGTAVQTINLNVPDYTIPLNNFGFPINGTIKWICRNHKYTKDEFYVLINVTNSTKNIDMIYRCTINIQGAVYTKVCDYSYGNYNCVYDTMIEYNSGELFRPYYRSPERTYPINEYGAFSNNTFKRNDYGVINTPTVTYRPTTAQYNWSYFSNGNLINGILYNTIFNSLSIRLAGNFLSETSNPYRNRTTPKCMVSDRAGNIYITNYGNPEEKDRPAVYKYDINTKQFSDFYVGLTDDVFHGIELMLNRYLFISNTSKKNILGFDLESQSQAPNSVRYNFPLNDSPTIISNVKSNDAFVTYGVTEDHNLHIFTSNNKKYTIKMNIRTEYRDILSVNLQGNPHTFGDISPDNLGIVGYHRYYENFLSELFFSSGGLLYELRIDRGSGNTRGIRRVYDEVNFGGVSYITTGTDNVFYVIGGNKNIFRLSNEPLSLNITLPKINLKQGFLPNIIPNTYGTVSTFAGGSGVSGWLDGTAINSKFTFPNGIAFDSNGNLFVADRGNHCIRKITPGGVVSTFAGAVGVSGWIDGTGTNARFNSPHGLAIDSDNTIYVADTDNHIIRKITPQGVVTRYAGSVAEPIGGIAGFRDGPADGTGIGQVGLFRRPMGIAVTRDKHVYVADTYNHAIRLIIPPPGGGVLTIAGGSTSGNIDGQGEAARFNYPIAIAIDSNGPGEYKLYVSDGANNRIRKVTLGGLVTTSVFINSPTGIVVDLVSNIYVGEGGNSRIRKITPEGNVSIVAGDSTLAGFTNGVGLNSRFNIPYGLAIDPNNNDLYVSENNNHSIRRIDIRESIVDVCDSNLNALVRYLPKINTRTNIGGIDRFDNPRGIVKDSSGNLYVLSIGDKTIYKVTPTLTITPYISGLNSLNGGITITSNGTIYITNTNNTISKISINSNSFTASLSAPLTGQSNTSLNNIVTATVFPTTNLTVGNLIQITDSSNPSNTGTFTILDIPSPTTFQFYNPGGFISANVTCVNTSPISRQFYDGSGGNLKYPTDLVIDNNGNMFILNKSGRTISKLVMSSLIITQFTSEFSVIPSGLVIDSSNNLYFLNHSDNSVAKVDTSGNVDSSFNSGITNTTDIYHENNKLYILTTERKYWVIDLNAHLIPSLNLLNNTPYIPATAVGTTTSITQPISIPDGTEYINVVLIGGGGSGGTIRGGGSGAQLKFRIKVGSYDINGTYVPFKNRRTFKFDVGRGGDIGVNNGGDTKINFFASDGVTISQQDLFDVFIAGGGKSGGGTGEGGGFPRISDGSIRNLNIANVSNNPFKYITEYNNALRRFVLVTSQVNEGAAGDQFNFVDILGSMTGNDGLPGDNLFNIDSIGGDLNNSILYLDPINSQLGPSNILNANFKKIPTTSSSKTFDLGLYPPGKGGDSGMSGTDGLVAWFFEGPSQYTLNTLHPGFRVPLSLINQKFDSNWFTLPFKPESAIISTVDQNNSNNTTATFLCDTDGNITLVNGGSGYSVAVSGFPSGEVKIKRSENSIFNSGDDILIIVNSIGNNGNILTWSLYPGTVVIPKNHRLYNVAVPDGVTKVDVAMIGSGGSPGAFIREPLVRLSTDLYFSIIVTRTITTDVTYNRAISGVYEIPDAEGTKTETYKNQVSFEIPAGNYPLAEFVNKINRIYKENVPARRDYTTDFRFKALTPENLNSSSQATYGFVLDNPVIFQDHTDVTRDFAGSTIYTKRYIQTYSMQLELKYENQIDPSIFYSQEMNNQFGPIHTYTTGTYTPEEYRYTPGPDPINDLGRGKTLKRISFPLNIINGGSRVSITTDPLTDGHIIQSLPSFDGGDGSPGEYKRTTLNVNSGDILKIKVGRYVNTTGILPRTSVNDVGFTSAVGNPNGNLGNQTDIQVNNNPIIIATGGIGGLPNPKTNAGKPGLPPNSLVYPTTGLPPEWQDGYGAGGITIRDTNQYDNPILRSSNGCVMIKFS